ncbi:MAG: histidinol dehydrogenase, partial [Candidatus Omnitrophica bacterium]|nr:histidinol dehydrogenase [Candidatus Omnitrophota bacterium]
MIKTLRLDSPGIQNLYDRNLSIRKKRVEEKVSQIIQDVKAHGDDAVLKYTRRFDGAKLTAKDLQVPEREISGAFQNITSDFINDLKTIINNVTLFYKKQGKKPCRVKHEEGVLLC